MYSSDSLIDFSVFLVVHFIGRPLAPCGQARLRFHG
jgi:hypothetical protein